MSKEDNKLWSSRKVLDNKYVINKCEHVYKFINMMNSSQKPKLKRWKVANCMDCRTKYVPDKYWKCSQHSLEIMITWVSVFSYGLNYSTSKTCTEMSVNRQFIKEHKFIYLMLYEAECLHRMLLDPLRDCFGWVTSSPLAWFWGVWRNM